MAHRRTGNPRGRPPHPGPLTPAEERVLDQLRLGKTNAEIAVVLGVSPDAVKYHVSNMLSKLGLSDRHELASWVPEREPARRWWAVAVVLAIVRGRPLRWAAGTALLAVAVVLAGLVVLRVRGEEPPEPIVAASSTLSVSSTPSAPPAVAADRPTPSPTPPPAVVATPTPQPPVDPNAEIAFVGVEDASTGAGNLYAARPDGSGQRRITDGDHAVFSPGWSPDGEMLAYIEVPLTGPRLLEHPDSTLVVVGRDGSGRRELAPGAWVKVLPGDVAVPRWYPDGRGVLYTSAAFLTYLRPIVPDEPTDVTIGILGCVNAVVSPDGQMLACAAFRSRRGHEDNALTGGFLRDPRQ